MNADEKRKSEGIMDTNDKQIINASEAIDEALSRMTKENRGATSRNILKEVRDLNDHIAQKVWNEIEPHQPMSINKVASKFLEKRDFKYIAKFDKFLRKSLSHFTPNEDGAERLMLKYYKYLIIHKRLLKNRYGIDIIKNVDLFLEDIDEQTQKYYESVVEHITSIDYSTVDEKGYDIYYISKTKPFFVKQNIYYEITLEPADEKPNKFNRITAFTKFDIDTNYAVALKFCERNITAFDVELPIKIIVGWKVSIRPCEINNFAKIFNINTNIQRGHNEYKTLMTILQREDFSLIDLIDSPEKIYQSIINEILNSTRDKRSIIAIILDHCREMTVHNSQGINVIRYLLVTMNNRKIKDQFPTYTGKSMGGFFLSSKCIPFDRMPFSFNPKGHHSNIYEVRESVVEKIDRDDEQLARRIRNNTEQLGILFSSAEDLGWNCSQAELEQLAQRYNARLDDYFKPDSELDVYKDHFYQKKYDKELVYIMEKLNGLVEDVSIGCSDCFSADCVEALKSLPKGTLDDPFKENVLKNMFQESRVYFIYGAAGTGKSTLINHIAKLMQGKNRAFLAKTNPAVENLKRKVIAKEFDDCFVTIDKFTKNEAYLFTNYDLIVVDECSTVKNEEIVKIIDMLGTGVLVLAGDIYQIPAIGFGNWFTFCKSIMPKKCVAELVTPYRSDDKELKEFWDEVRNIKSDNVVLEEIVRNEYSHSIDKSILDKKSKDEIILCLNYNGLYGLNNINKLLQLGNPNKGIELGVWTFKVGDPILFNDSERFEVLYNNLKGRIIDIEDNEDSVSFTVEVGIELIEREVKACFGLELLSVNGGESIVKFNVARRAPYSSDNDDLGNEHVIPFQVAYAVSIHKSQGLEYESVKIVIADDSEERITHNIFYTAITRATKFLTIYWSPEVGNRVLNRLKLESSNKDFYLFKSKHGL